MEENIVSLSKDCWIPDIMAKACYKCEKSFNSFRRRHHCRYCGLLFCAKCSKTKLQLKNGIELERTCEKCYDVLLNPRIKAQPEMAQYPHFPKDNTIFREEDADETKTESNVESNEELPKILGENQEKNSSPECLEEEEFGNTQELDDFLENRSKNMLNEINARDWETILPKVIKETVQNIRPTKKDALNLNKYLKVVNFPGEAKCRFFKGIVFKKILANKRMVERHFNPKILILSGYSGFFLGEKKIVSMQKLIEQEENFTKIFIELLVNNIQPNIIIVEKTMPFLLIDELSKIGISVLLNVKKKNLKLLSRMSNGKILSSINQSLYQNGTYLGNCVEFWQEKIGQNIYCFFKAPETSNLCGSILFNPQGIDKKLVKSIITKMCVQFRSALLENSLFSHFGVTKAKYEDFHSSGSLFIHLSTSRNKLCSRPKVHQIEYYSKNGKALGDFLMFNLTNAYEKCENSCEKRIFEHKYYYFKEKSRVKISIFKVENKENCLKVSRFCNECLKQTEFKPLSSLAWKFSFNKFIDNFFKKGLLVHSTCPHDFFKKGRFVFTFSGFSLVIELEQNQEFKICRKIEYNYNAIVLILQDNLEKINIYAEKIYSELKSTKDFICQTFFLELDDEESNQVSKFIGKIEEKFNIFHLNFIENKNFTCQNYLQVEGLRKKLWQDISEVFLSIETCIDTIQKLPNNKGFSILQIPVRKKSSSANLEVYNYVNASPNKCNILKSKEFLFFQQGFFNFPSKDTNFCVSINEEDSLSLIAYSLNSGQYFKEFEEYLNESSNLDQKIEANLLATKDNHFLFSHSNYDENEIKEISQREVLKKLYGDHLTIKVISYFCKEFQGIRNIEIGSHTDYLLSISSSLDYRNKNNMFSVDQRFAVKKIEKKELSKFLEFAPGYFRHVCKHKFHGMPSCLLKIFGAYAVSVKNHTTGKSKQEYILIFENLLYNINDKNLIFELKGNLNKRKKTQDEEKGKADLNFMEYMNGVPLILSKEEKKNIEAEIWNDTLFLSQQNSVDYTFLLILDHEKNFVNYGICDYVEKFNLEKEKIKAEIANETSTIVYPKEYKNRFRQNITQIYFMSVEP